jgi:hypothetical protein
MFLFILCWCKEWKLLPDFLQKVKVLGKQFQPILTKDIDIIDQFEDFLRDHYGFVKTMNESQFMDYIINLKSGEPYKDFIKYLPLHPFWL